MLFNQSQSKHMFWAANEIMECKASCITCHAVRWASSPLCVQGAPYPRQNHTSKTETILQHLCEIILPKTNIQHQPRKQLKVSFISAFLTELHNTVHTILNTIHCLLATNSYPSIATK